MSAATISRCGQYRYTLTREWAQGPDAVLWLMLNPSTADATQNDATIRRCIGFSKLWGYSRLHVVNLYAYRSTHPNALWSVGDPIGPENDDHILDLAAKCRRVICAWGQPGPNKERAPAVRAMLAQAVGNRTMALRINQNGCPSHPLRLPYDLDAYPWTP